MQGGLESFVLLLITLALEASLADGTHKGRREAPRTTQHASTTSSVRTKSSSPNCLSKPGRYRQRRHSPSWVVPFPGWITENHSRHWWVQSNNYDSQMWRQRKKVATTISGPMSKQHILHTDGCYYKTVLLFSYNDFCPSIGHVATRWIQSHAMILSNAYNLASLFIFCGTGSSA